MKIRKITALLLVLAMVLSCGAFAGAQYISHDWAKADIDAVVSEGLMPEGFPSDLTSEISRSEFAALAVSVYEKAAGEISVTQENKFTDTDDAAVLKALEIGVTQGVSETEFMPDRNITRQEICVMLHRLIAALEINVPVTLELIIFDDGEKIAPWASFAVETMYKLRIINGVTSDAEVAVIDPLSSTTRQQAVVMVWRMYDKYIADAGVSEEEIYFETAKNEPSYIAAGKSTSYKVTSTGALSAWGLNDKFQLGLDNNNETVYTESVAENVASVAAFGSRAYYVTRDGGLYEFGDGKTPERILENVFYVLPLKDNTFALTNNGELYAWGSGEAHTLGTGKTDSEAMPVMILENVSKVVANGGFAAALTNDGEVYQWGDTRVVSVLYGADDIENKTPAFIMDGVRDIACGTSHLLMLTPTGELYGWGSNLSGQLVPASAGNRYEEPVLVKSGVLGMWADNEITFFTNTEKDLYVIGKNTGERMGNNSIKENALASEPLYVMAKVEKVFINANSAFAIRSDGWAWAWGKNYNYRLGLGDENDRRTPVPFNKGALNFAFGYDHTLMQRDDGKLYVWGVNEENQCSSRTYEYKMYKEPHMHSNIEVDR